MGRSILISCIPDTQCIYNHLPSTETSRLPPTKMINPHIPPAHSRPHPHPFHHPPYQTPPMPPLPLPLPYLSFLKPSPHYFSLFYLTHHSLLHQRPFPGPPSIYSRPRISPRRRRSRSGSIILSIDRFNIGFAVAGVAVVIAASGWVSLPSDNRFVEGGDRNESFPFVLRESENILAFVR